MDEPTKEKVLLALEPRVVMAAMHTTTIRASITAYSTAVGPSSAFRKATNPFVTRTSIASLRGIARAGWYPGLGRAPGHSSALNRSVGREDHRLPSALPSNRLPGRAARLSSCTEPG